MEHLESKATVSVLCIKVLVCKTVLSVINKVNFHFGRVSVNDSVRQQNIQTHDHTLVIE